MADRLLGLRIRIPPGPWMFVSCECFVLLHVQASAAGLSLIQGRLTEYDCANECDLETSTMKGPRPELDRLGFASQG